MTIRRGLTLLTAVVLLAGCTASTPPEPEVTADPIPAVEQFFHELPGPADPLSADDAAAYSGIGQVWVTGQCTGTLLDTGHDDGPAYVLTNGHCANGWGEDGNLVVQDDDSVQGWATMHFGLVEGQDAGPVLDVAEVTYSTMARRDVAFVRLDGTLGEARAQGLEPLPLATTAPQPGDAVLNLGVPVRGIDFGDWVLREGQCTLREQVDVLEQLWAWDASWANDCPGILQGSSGSPLVADGAVVAVINTTTFGGFVRGGECSINNPCEVGSGGTRVVADTSYAAPVDDLADCFDGTGTFVLDEGCPLPRPGVTTRLARAAVTLDEVQEGADGLEVELLSDADETTQVRYGLAPVAPGACEDGDVYTGTTSVPPGAADSDGLIAPTTIELTLPAVEGRSFVCLSTGEDAPAARTIVDVDGTPPVFDPGVIVHWISDESVQVSAVFAAPELALVKVKSGPAAGTDCDDDDGYGLMLSVASQFTSDELPIRYCVRASDLAGNQAPTAGFVVTASTPDTPRFDDDAS